MEERQLTYIGAIAKNRRVYYPESSEGGETKYRLEDLAQQLAPEHFMPVELVLEKPRSVWVALIHLRLPKLQQRHWVAIQLNAATFAEATEVDYFIINAPSEHVTASWMVQTFSERNWVEVFYREAKNWLGLNTSRLSFRQC